MPVYAPLVASHTRTKGGIIVARVPWQRLSRRTAYVNDWIAVYHDEVVRPDGRTGTYGVVHSRPEAVSVLPVRGDEVLLVGQYRYPLQSYSWEIPGGAAEPGEEPEQAGRRELAEETGYRGGAWRELARLSLWNAVTDARCLIFVATDLTEGAVSPDGTEELEIRWVTRAEALDMTRSGDIHDAITLVALSRLALDGRDEPPSR